MARIVSVHSFRGGTGKSNTTANLAACVAAAGKRVGIVDTDIASPGIHVLFGLDEAKVNRALNDYLYGRCEIGETSYDVTPPLIAKARGKVFLIPASLKPGDIARVLKEGYNVNRLSDGFSDLIKHHALDYLFIDTHPGLNEETLLCMALSDVLILILRPDKQDYQGTAVTVEVAKKLNVQKLYLVVNKALPGTDLARLKQEVEAAYRSQVAAVFPHTDEMMALASDGLFVLKNPHHPLTAMLAKLAALVKAD